METTETNSESPPPTPTEILNKKVRAAAFFGATVGAPMGGWIGYEWGLKRGLKGVDLARFTMRRVLYGSIAFGCCMIAGVIINFREPE